MVHVADVPALACSGSLRLFLFTEVSVPEAQVSPSPPRHPEVPEGPSPRPDGCAGRCGPCQPTPWRRRIGLGARALRGELGPGAPALTRCCLSTAGPVPSSPPLGPPAGEPLATELVGSALGAPSRADDVPITYYRRRHNAGVSMEVQPISRPLCLSRGLLGISRN